MIYSHDIYTYVRQDQECCQLTCARTAEPAASEMHLVRGLLRLRIPSKQLNWDLQRISCFWINTELGMK